MPTKTEYREYIASEEWREKRRWFIVELGYNECNRCGLPRWLCVIAYDEDLHVHHKSYARVGEELETDLESLCKRCHEIETFGRSELHEVRQVKCEVCGIPTFDNFSKRCATCNVVVIGAEHDIHDCHFLAQDSWADLLWSMAQTIPTEDIFAYLLANERKLEEIRAIKQMHENGQTVRPNA